MGCRRSLQWLLGSALALGAAASFAGEITLYAQPAFEGRFITSNDSLPSLSRSAFQDVASSAIVGDGIWEACTGENFHGTCTQLTPGQYASLDTALKGRILSVRQIGFVQPSAPRVGVAPPPAAVAPAPSAMPRIVLFEHTASGLRSAEFTGTQRDLVGFGRVDSATIYSGLWRLCDRQGGQGQCVEYAPGQYGDLGMLDHRVRSVELVGAARVSVAPAPLAPRVVLYEFPDFAGRSIAIEGSVARNLAWERFANRASSIRVEAGTWLFCTGPDFTGDCRTLGPGEYPRLTWNLDRQISSARLVSSVG